MTDSIGVAVIGAGMAGRAHAAAYRAASTVFASTLPPIRLVSVGDVSEEFGRLAAERFGYERNDTSWQAIAADPGIHVVSVVVANSLHREIVEGLVAAGKHVLCEKPLSDSLEDAEAMAELARGAATVVRVGHTYLRAPGIAFIRSLIDDGTLGAPRHFSGAYMTDYASNPRAAMSWRFRGTPGTGALADVGSHLAYISEFLCGAIESVSGGRFVTAIAERPLPLGAVIGHGSTAVSDETEAVTNDDFATFNASFASGAAGNLSVSRIAHGHANSLSFEVFCERGSARWDQNRPSEIRLFLTDDRASTNGYRTVTLGPAHPYLAGGLAMDAPAVGFGQNDLFVYQARAFLEEVAGIPEEESLPRVASFDDGVHNMTVIRAVAESAAADGAAIAVPTALAVAAD